jgi:hypothetical protein
MMNLRMMLVALGVALLTGCASTGPSGVERWVDSLPSTAAGGASLADTGAEGAAASDSSDPCASASRRMSKIRCRW